MQSDLMTYDEVATFFRVETRTIKRWVSMSKETSFPKPIRISHKCVYFKKSDIEAWLNSKQEVIS